MAKHLAKILVVDDDPDVLTAARVVLRQKFSDVQTERIPEKLNFLVSNNQYDVIILDMNFSSGKTTGIEGLTWLKQIRSLNPQQQVIVMTAYGDIKLAVEAMKHGAIDFIVKPWDNEKLEATVFSAFKYAESRKELSRLKSRNTQLSRVMNPPEEQPLGDARSFREVLNTVHKIASTDANVLILGENGTGKELIAKFIHHQSHRREHVFIKVDVSSLSNQLFESELFGHRKGAFTDAREDRTGRMELANGGTLFLDEVGNLPLNLQVKLLSAIQNREVIPVGSNKPVTIDIRLICATNLAIHEAVKAGQFREDLLYRINTVEITVPPLRKRTEDIPKLTRHFLNVYNSKYRKEKSISEEAIRFLRKHSWPGNVRELQHAVERAVIMGEHTVLEKNDFFFSPNSPIAGDDLSLDALERNAILKAIEKCKGNMSKVAKELGVGRTTLYRKMVRYQIAMSEDAKTKEDDL